MLRRLGAVHAHLTPLPSAATVDVGPAEIAPPVDPDVELIYKKFDIPSRRLQAEWRAQWIAERVNGILPQLMDESGVEFWVVSQKEYGEDTCWRALTPATQQAARRRSVIVFRRTPEGVEQRIFIGFWKETWEDVRAFLCSGGGGDIAVNRSKTSAFADGMAAGEFDAFEEGVGAECMARVKYPELLPTHFLMLRAPSMLPHYRDACELSHAVMCESMSNNVITPGQTTCADVSWWMWQRSIDLGFECWFQPSFGVQRPGVSGTLDGDTVIERGDMLWTDYGIDYAGMMTDQQHMGYVCNLGESAPPQGLVDGLTQTNWMQDTILEEMQVGRTGNEVLAAFDARMRAEGINGTMYPGIPALRHSSLSALSEHE